MSDLIKHYQVTIYEKGNTNQYMSYNVCDSLNSFGSLHEFVDDPPLNDKQNYITKCNLIGIKADILPVWEENITLLSYIRILLQCTDVGPNWSSGIRSPHILLKWVPPLLLFQWLMTICGVLAFSILESCPCLITVSRTQDVVRREIKF